MAISDKLGLRRGDVVSLTGCGGKTALLHRLAAENRAGPVLLGTTTKIRRPPAELVDFDGPASPLPAGVTLFARDAGGGKLGGVPPAALAAHIPPDGLTLLESDGSRGLPLKGWADWEPVLHPATTVTVAVCVLWPLGSPGTGRIHRPDCYTALTGAAEADIVTPAHIAAMLTHPEGMLARTRGRCVLFINQVPPEGMEAARQLCRLLPGGLAVCAGEALYGTAVRLQ